MRVLSRNLGLSRWLGVLFGLALLLGLGGPISAPAADSSSSPSPVLHGPGSPSSFSNSVPMKAGWPLFADNWIGTVFSKLELWLKDRTHMIQFAAIAMVIGLLIIWWRKT
jgi:hypothetical protein